VACRAAETHPPGRRGAAAHRVGRRLQDHPRWLERAYRTAHAALAWIAPRLSRRGAERASRWIRTPEGLLKRWVFDCRSCGQCVLHSTGMTCPMTCPKELRNGPCGGVRADGCCEVAPGVPCAWLEAILRARSMAAGSAELVLLQPPLDRRLQGRSAWQDLLTGVDRPPARGWPDARRPGRGDGAAT
jgi:hypothetical protein